MPEKNQGKRLVSDLTYGYSGHNVTCDNILHPKAWDNIF